MNFKDLIFIVYSLFFNLGAKVGVKSNRVALISMHNAHFNDGLGEVEAEFKSRGKYDIVKVERTDLNDKLGAIKFLTLNAFKTGRSKFIFLNDNYLGLGYCKPSSETKIVQLWHGQGAFKKFGFDIDVAPDVRRRERAANEKLSYVVASSASVKDIYAGAFGVTPDKVLTLGSPNADYYFRKVSKNFARERLYELYPELEGKKVILYAPTFREDGSNVLNVGFSKLQDDDTYVLVRLHPQVHNNEFVRNAFDVTDYDNVNELCSVADLLITDYSSICMDFALQDKPVVYYAYDLENYKGARDFYFDYETYVGGPVVKTEEELVKTVKRILKGNENKLDTLKLNINTPIGMNKPKTKEIKIDSKAKKFKDFNFDNLDGRATERLVDFLLK